MIELLISLKISGACVMRQKYLVFLLSKKVRGLFYRESIQLTQHIGPTHLFENLRGIGDETNVFGVFIVSKSQGPVLQGIYAVYST